MEAIKRTEFKREPLKDRQQAGMRTLMRWLWLMKKTCVKHCIGCWTFLWLYRDWKFIDNDLDIDINVILDWNWDYMWEESYIKEIFKDWTLIRTMHHEWRVQQLAYMSPEEVIFDMTMYYTGIKEWKVVSYSVCWTVEEDEYLFDYIIPTPSEEYLEKRYWERQTPLPAFQEWNTYCKTLVSKDIIWI